MQNVLACVLAFIGSVLICYALGGQQGTLVVLGLSLILFAFDHYEDE